MKADPAALLAAAAQAELAAVYSRTVPEHRSIDDPLVASQNQLLDLVLDVEEPDLDSAEIAEEARHLQRFGVPVLEIADRLGVPVGRVRAALRGAA